MRTIDQAHGHLDRIGRTYGQLDLASASEAETRFQVIDQILMEVLGWPREQISVEDRIVEDGKTTYADYKLATHSTTIVVEAKRAGAAFELPTRKRLLKLGGVLSEGEVGAAIRQARDYARGLAIPFSVVTNGNAWLAFAAVRTDGVRFEDTDAHIFRTLDDVRERFVEFWELLSYERVLEGNIGNVLLGRSLTDVEHRNLRQVLSEPNFRLGRNSLYEHIEPAVAAALSDEALLESPDALEACYVKTGERVKFDSRLRMYLSDPMPPLGQPATRLRTRKQVEKLEDHISSESGLRRFIVLLGPVGAGKTTFLHYTRKVSAAASIAGKVMWLLVDFKKATEEDSPREFILRELLALIEADSEFGLGDWAKGIRPAYRRVIEDLRRGPLHLLAEDDPKEFNRHVANLITKEREEIQPYVERVLQHAGTIRPGYLVIDNVDQIENLDRQGAIFVEAQALARRIGVSVIMSLRESTYLKHRARAVFDAFQFDVFYLDAPNVQPVLSHRFAYAKRVLSGKATELKTEKGIRLVVPDLGQFFEIVAKSLLSDDTGHMLEALAGGNIRRGLTLVREFLSSGHVNADHAMAAFLKQGDYYFPRHEVLRGAVLGQMKYFSDKTSLVPNIYDAKLGSRRLQLLRLKVVERLLRGAADSGFEGLSVEEIVGTLSRFGLAETDAMKVVSDLAAGDLIRTTDGLDVKLESQVFPTRLAGYTVRVLCRMFVYNEFCLIDTLVHDDAAWEDLRERTLDIESTTPVVERIELRIDRVKAFIDYLLAGEERWVVECRRRDLSDPWQGAALREEISPHLEEEFEKVRRSATRRYGPQAVDVTSEGESESARRGTIVNSWPDKEYVFIRDDGGVDWFSHRQDFADPAAWKARGRNSACIFVPGEWKGKPRATEVRLV